MTDACRWQTSLLWTSEAASADSMQQSATLLLELGAGNLFLDPSHLAYIGDMGSGASRYRRPPIAELLVTCHLATHGLRLCPWPPAVARIDHVLVRDVQRCTGSYALTESARYFNPRCRSGAENVVVKTFHPGLVQPEDLQPLIGEVATLSMLRHRQAAAPLMNMHARMPCCFALSALLCSGRLKIRSSLRLLGAASVGRTGVHRAITALLMQRAASHSQQLVRLLRMDSASNMQRHPYPRKLCAAVLRHCAPAGTSRQCVAWAPTPSWTMIRQPRAPACTTSKSTSAAARCATSLPLLLPATPLASIDPRPRLPLLVPPATPYGRRCAGACRCVGACSAHISLANRAFVALLCAYHK